MTVNMVYSGRYPDSNIFVHIPFAERGRYLPIALRDGFNPELYLSAQDLDSLDYDELERVRASVADAGLSCIMHGPFMELSAGGADPLVRAVTRRRILQAIQAASVLNARSMVVHAAYDRFKYGDMFDLWLENSIRFWTEVGQEAAHRRVMLALENTWEDTPEPLCRLVDGLGPEVFGHCLDIGHFNVFGRTSLAEWVGAVGDRLLELHLHDNHGESDEHLAIGKGHIDFGHLFVLIPGRLREVALTLEAHDEQGMRDSKAELLRLLGAAE